MTDIDDLRITPDRLWASLMAMADIGARNGGNNRQALTDEDKRARDLFTEWARGAGCTIAVDAVGNIFARFPGQDDRLPAVLSGSHLDTQESGGRFDGVYGVMAALEAVRTLRDNAIRPRRSIEIVVWTNEEGCRFTPAMLGSGVVAGAHDLAFAYSRIDKDGHNFRGELTRIGYLGDLPATPRPYAAALEVHIEQGPVLEQEGDTIGIVTGIQGVRWLDIELVGQSCHAGPTPMTMRRDPWRAATEIIRRALQLADENAPFGRCTIGDMNALPGARNTVPGVLKFPIDIRHPDAGVLENLVATIRDIVAEEGDRTGISSSVEQAWDMPATTFAPALVETVEASARMLGLRARRMVSGAGHDSLHTARFAPTAMIFVPCAGGLSHNESEYASPEDLAAGANVLLHSILKAAA